MSLAAPPDVVVRALLPGSGLQASLALVSGAAQEARRRHGLQPVPAALLAQALAGGVLLASLQKGEARINLQLQCDGPLKGLFVDAGAGGDCRGYVRNPSLQVGLGEGAYRWHPALGNSGLLSVLRDLGSEYYRSSVELRAMDLAADLDHYFATSDQVPTRVALELRGDGQEDLAVVAGLLVQALPDGEVALLERLGASLVGDLGAAVEGGAFASGRALLEAVVPGVQVTHEYPVAFRCSCSKERVLQTLGALGRQQLQEIVDTQGSAAVTCQFCAARHEVTLVDLLRLLDEAGDGQARS
jgi:molecular chaperone Hsp33